MKPETRTPYFFTNAQAPNQNRIEVNMVNRADPPAPKAPDHLSSTAKAWWASVVADYALEPHHLKLLQAAAESWDRLQEARETLDKLGLTYLDRFGAPRSRPEVAIERDARTAVARLIRELDLDTAPPESPRPPALRSNRRGA